MQWEGERSVVQLIPKMLEIVEGCRFLHVLYVIVSVVYC